jgi:hypothetical protein
MGRDLAEHFCSCIKKVKKSINDENEGRAIAICVKSVLHTRGKTIKRFRCRTKKPYIETQAKFTRRQRRRRN